MGCKSHAEPAKVYKAPDFELTDLNGKKVSLSGLKGKVVFLDFWATWCPPCVMSVPEVEKVFEEYSGKNVVVLSVSLDSSEAPVRTFMATHKMMNRVAMAGNSGVDSKYNIEGIPAYFIVDQQGNIAKAWGGYNPVMPAMWRKEIDRLLVK
jgi:peroxiredoxin